MQTIRYRIMRLFYLGGSGGAYMYMYNSIGYRLRRYNVNDFTNDGDKKKNDKIHITTLCFV